jgi:hypothetical protein
VSTQEHAGGDPSLATDAVYDARTGGAAQPTEEQPTEEQLRAAYEAELSRISSADMVLQAAASLLNIGAYRLGLTGPPEDAGGAPQRDLAQVRDAIDAVRGLLGVIERSRPQELGPLREALSQLQMAYAQAAQAEGAAPEPAAAPAGSPVATPSAAQSQSQPQPQGAPVEGGTPDSGPGPAESSGRLWVPGR